ncbi:MAG TPA: DUF2231 domain-containing protein [Rhizomicrobium sp.]|jgi:uncharacterized membrane protein
MQTASNPRSTVQIAGHPVHVMLVPFVIAFYTGCFAADLAFAYTGDEFWARGAYVLLITGVAASALAATVGLLDFLFEPRIRALNAAWWHFAGNAAAALVSIVDLYLRWREGAAAGSHDYMWMSLVVFLLLLFNGWMGWSMVYKHHVGVADA